VLTDLRQRKKGTPDYQSAYGYLAALDREATTVLLELLAAEKDRTIRRYLIEILKELGKSQIETIGKRVSDSRWYFVRNIISILGETRDEEALSFLEQVIIRGLVLVEPVHEQSGHIVDRGAIDQRLDQIEARGSQRK